MKEAKQSVIWNGIIREFMGFLPKVKDENIVTLREGNTPLIEAVNLEVVFGKGIKIFLKYEGLNPTGSFKDRGMTMAVSKAKEDNSHAIICASTGNTSAAAAAYAARGGLRAYVLIPEGKIALGKLSQAMMHGATVIQVEGNFDDALTIVKDVSKAYPITLVNSINPYRIEGQKTAAFEVCSQLGDLAPSYHFLPVGNAGNITAYWKGYKEFKEKGIIKTLPKMMGFEAEGAAPIVKGHPIKNPETVASAIRIGNPSSWDNAVKARDESGGAIDMVSDNEIIHAYKLLAKEGVFCEPASAASLAGAIKMHKKGIFKNGDTIVCTLTGHGLKDPDTAIKSSEKPVTVPPDLKKVVKVLGF